MVEEFFYVPQWANADMYIMSSSMYMPMHVPSLNKDFTIIIIIIILSLQDRTAWLYPHSQHIQLVRKEATMTLTLLALLLFPA